MRVGIVGGGASGLICAWLLDPRHEVTLFEAAPACGGHIRTPGHNTALGDIPTNIVLDNGVIEFEPRSFVRFHQLLEALDVPREIIRGSTSVHLADGRRLVSPGAIDREPGGVLDQLTLLGRLVTLAFEDRRFRRQAARLCADPEVLRETPISHLLRDDIHCRWLRMLLMYAYSTPYAETGKIAASLAAPVLVAMTQASAWTRIMGGVYSYCERILGSLRGRVHVSTPVRAVARTPLSARVTTWDDTVHIFDRVVLATPPHRVLPLLTDPSDDERRRFGAWTGSLARTVIHTDFSIYAPWGDQRFSEFDLFEALDGHSAGYNAYLNRLCGVDAQTPYGMAYGLEDRIDPAAILQVEEHDVPVLSVAALRYRHEVIATNGQNNTFFAGAWLGDGLHEGATRSALAVSARLEGRLLYAH